MKYKLTKKEALFLWRIINIMQDRNTTALGEQIKTLEAIDKAAKDKKSRSQIWLEESAQEWDEIQTIKAKLGMIIDTREQND